MGKTTGLSQFCKILILGLFCASLVSCKNDSTGRRPSKNPPIDDKNPGDNPPGSENPPDGSLQLSPSTGDVSISGWGLIQSLNDLPGDRRDMAVARMNDGRIFVSGGSFQSALVPYQYYNSTFIYTLGGVFSLNVGSSTNGPNMQSVRHQHKMITLNDNRVLIFGGLNASGNNVTFAEVYNPATNTTASIDEVGCETALASGSLNAVKLQDGRVLVHSSTATEIFDPEQGVQGCFTPSGSPNISRLYATSTLLNNGLVLFAGSSGVTAELYDPNTETFTYTQGNMTESRNQHTASLLPDGKVLLAGGMAGDLFTRRDSAEVYDPDTDSFTAVGSLSVARARLYSVALTSGVHAGKVVVFGGISVDGAMGFSGNGIIEFYDPDTETFSRTPFDFDSTGIANAAVTLDASGSRALTFGGWSSGSRMARMLNTNIGGVISLAASGGAGGYNFSVSPAHGTISGAQYLVPPEETQVTLTVTDSANTQVNALLNFVFE